MQWDRRHDARASDAIGCSLASDYRGASVVVLQPAPYTVVEPQSMS